MSLRSGHGQGRGRPHVEVLPVDELPAGVPGPPRPVAVRDPSGRFVRFVKSDGTAALAREGGKAAGESKQLARLLGLSEVDDTHPWAPYSRLARDWRDDHVRSLAASIGGGEVGPGPASIISSAALQLAASRWMSDRAAETGDAKGFLDAQRLADSSRQNVLAAFELVAKEAVGRAKHGRRDPVTALRASLRGGGS